MEVPRLFLPDLALRGMTTRPTTTKAMTTVATAHQYLDPWETVTARSALEMSPVEEDVPPTVM